MMSRLDTRLSPWILRAALLVSTAGYVAWMTTVDETPLLAWFWSPRDVGGLDWGESAALAVQRVIALAVGIAALLVLWRPWSVLLWGMFLFQFAWATAMSQKQEGFPLDLVAWDDTPLAFLAVVLPYLFPYATEAARIVLPLCLWRMVVALRTDPLSMGRSVSAEWLARGGIALTFAAHGIEALSHYPAFVDMLIVSLETFGLPQLGEDSATTLLTLIGGIDLVLAVLVLVRRWPPVAAYMACWGLVTALARIPARGWELGSIDAAVRVAHFALPVVLLVWWLKAPGKHPTASHPHEPTHPDPTNLPRDPA